MTIFYIIVAALIALTLILGAVLGGGAEFNGLDMSAFIFLFVSGLNGFKPQFHMLLQNGVSRRTLWCSFAISAACISLAMGLVSSLLPLTGLDTEPLYHSLYGSWSEGYRFTFTGLMWSWMFGMAFMSFGFFLTTLYFRMSKLLKVIVSIGVPALLFVILPMMEAFIPSFKGFTTLLKSLAWLMGFSGLNTFPWRAIGSAATLSALSLALSFLLVRRASPR